MRGWPLISITLSRETSEACGPLGSVEPGGAFVGPHVDAVALDGCDAGGVAAGGDVGEVSIVQLARPEDLGHVAADIRREPVLAGAGGFNPVVCQRTDNAIAQLMVHRGYRCPPQQRELTSTRILPSQMQPRQPEACGPAPARGGRSAGKSSQSTSGRAELQRARCQLYGWRELASKTSGDNRRR